MSMTNLFSKLQSEIADFNDNFLTLATGETSSDDVKYGKSNNGGYLFNQKKMLNLIDLYDNSKFESGIKDSEGQRKIFLNIGTFRSDVASKFIALGVKDYVFIPDDYDSIWKTWFFQRQFRVFARENNQGELINEFEEKFPKYGTIVSKRIGNKVERVSLKNLINTQDAKTLKQAATTGGYVIEEHDYTKYELSKFKDWKTAGLQIKDNKKIKVYERYALCEQGYIDEWNGKITKDETPVLSMGIFALIKNEDTKKYDNHCLYLQAISENDFPYEEEHWNKVDGRWLGIGEMEKQLENQIARNMSANLRRRAMMWSAKHLFQSPDEAVQKNLAQNVRDGQVMGIAPNGNITPIDMGTRALADFNADDALWEQNSNQRSFTFESSTGEQPPSGTPFRLQAMLSNTVADHWARKKEKFALFLIRSYFNQIIPICKKQSKEHTIMVAGGEEGTQHLVDAIKQDLVWQEFKKQLLNGRVADVNQLKTLAQQHVSKQRFHSVEVPQGWYDDAKFHMELEMTGQAVDTKQEIETMTNIFLAASKNSPDPLSDPRLVRLLEMIVSRTGKTMKDFMGDIKYQPQPMQPNLNAQPNPTPGVPPALG